MSYSQIFERLNNQNKSKVLSFLGNWIDFLGFPVKCYSSYSYHIHQIQYPGKSRNKLP